jgi:transposase
MTDTNALRRLAQAATPGPWDNTDPDPTIINSPYNQLAICYRNSRALTDAKFIAAANPAVISELLDRLEAAEKERDSVEKLADRLALALNTSNHERDNLRAKIERMEQQRPVGEIQRANSTGNYICSEVWVPLPVGSKLYALPGAKGEEK